MATARQGASHRRQRTAQADGQQLQQQQPQQQQQGMGMGGGYGEREASLSCTPADTVDFTQPCRSDLTVAECRWPTTG